MQYNHLSIEEREKIQELLWQKKSIRHIAKELGRSPSSIAREIKKNNSQQKKRYTPRLAHERALKKRSSRGQSKLETDAVLCDYVTTHLKLGWSPEQIAATAPSHISHEAIYQYVYAQVYRNGHGYVKPGREDLRPYLARRKKRRTPQGLRKSHRILKGTLPSIDDRPEVVNLRTEIGHWEDDLVVSRESADNLKTINERVSGIVFISKVPDGTAEAGDTAVSQRLKNVPKEYRQTLTRDRGSENVKYEKLATELNIQIFFAHPYSSFERGSNENLNGLIRRFFPKKTNFQLVTDAEIRRVEYLLNSRPRKRLGWKTPYEVFYELTGVALQV
ncbi:IS30 family transposase [Candidatus Nomurabacteria bacterium]|nr:IS30 family transposase [Candidatus Kaiserbacteria bacterium]MCB9814055.1 IS30 family transposase [Candidatus Nomurabacteria bacterium]